MQKNVYTCFIDLEKVYDRIHRENLCGVLREYCFDGRLLLAIKSLYSRSEDRIRVRGVKSQLFTVGVGLRQECVPSPLRFIAFMNWIGSHSRVDEAVTFGGRRINCLLFGDNLVLLASSGQGLQHALVRFSAACDQGGNKGGKISWVPKNPDNVTSTFFTTAHLLPKNLWFEHGGAKLAPYPGCHLTSLHTCVRSSGNKN